MLKTVIGKILGNRHEREARRLRPMVEEINRIVDELSALPEAELQAQTEKLRGRVKERTAALEEQLAQLRERKRHTESSDEREEIGLDMRRVEAELKALTQEALDDILPEAYATVKEACRRLMGQAIVVTGQPMKWDMIPYDVQLIGGIALHQGKVAEMARGEGKTLVATMPLYLNALAGRGVHLVTVNPYLAQRDSEWMGTIYRFLGLRVGCIVHGITERDRQDAYAADVTYGTNNEFGFDYLRDNMVVHKNDMVQRPLNYAIVDEVDSILIDEARTPLIISAPDTAPTDQYYQFAALVEKLKEEEDYAVDLKKKSATLTEAGIAKIEKLLGVENIYVEKGAATKKGTPFSFAKTATE